MFLMCFYVSLPFQIESTLALRDHHLILKRLNCFNKDFGHYFVDIVAPSNRIEIGN